MTVKSFENMVVLDLIKQRYNQNSNPNFYYFREQDRYEVDLIYKTGNQLIPIEIKSAETFSGHFLKNINHFKKIVGDRVTQAFVVYADNSGTLREQINQTRLINYRHTPQIFDEPQ